MKRTIYLFRHGATHYNRDKIFTGWKDSTLTPAGVRDARAVARKLEGKKFQVAFQTHLARSKRTLKEVLKGHPECRVVVTDDRMMERSYGALEGKSHKSVMARYGKKQYDAWHRAYTVAPPGGESFRDLQRRASEFLGELAADRQTSTVVAVTHAGIIRGLLAEALDLPLRETFRFHLDYGGVTLLRLDGAIPAVGYVNR